MIALSSVSGTLVSPGVALPADALRVFASRGDLQHAALFGQLAHVAKPEVAPAIVPQVAQSSPRVLPGASPLSLGATPQGVAASAQRAVRGLTRTETNASLVSTHSRAGLASPVTPASSAPGSAEFGSLVSPRGGQLSRALPANGSAAPQAPPSPSASVLASRVAQSPLVGATSTATASSVRSAGPLESPSMPSASQAGASASGLASRAGHGNQRRKQWALLSQRAEAMQQQQVMRQMVQALETDDAEASEPRTGRGTR